MKNRLNKLEKVLLKQKAPNYEEYSKAMQRESDRIQRNLKARLKAFSEGEPYPQRELANEEDLEIIKSYEKANYIKRDAIEAKERFEKESIYSLKERKIKQRTESLKLISMVQTIGLCVDSKISKSILM